MAIYTKTGDRGTTGLHGGLRVPKDDIRIEANGTLDELNSLLGVCRAYLPEEHEWHETLYRIQKEIMVVMSQVATPSEIRDQNPNTLDGTIVAWMEAEIDRIHHALGAESRYFILPGGTLLSAHLQLARTVARRAERQLWTAHRSDPLPMQILAFTNRLSDLLFVLGRYEMLRQGKPEEKWHHFLYKRRRGVPREERE